VADAYLLDMFLYAERACTFCKDATLESFLADEKLQMATLHALQVVGGAANKVSAEFRNAHPEVPWPRIIKLRHRLVHDYPRVEMPKVWGIVRHRIPDLIQALIPITPRESGDVDAPKCRPEPSQE
jgi:uncharacterized protein with HEPN domain